MDPEVLLRGLDVHPTSYEGLKVYFSLIRDQFIGIQTLQVQAYDFMPQLFETAFILQRGEGRVALTPEDRSSLLESFATASIILRGLQWMTDQFDASYQIFSALVYDFEQKTRYISLYDGEDVALVWAIIHLKPQQVLYVAAGGAKPLKERIIGNSFRRAFQQELEYKHLYALVAPEPGTHGRPTARRTNAGERRLFNFKRH